MKLIQILLKEGRKEDLKKKYFDKFDEKDLDFVLGIADLQDFNHKYTDFIFRGLDQKNDIDLWTEIGVQLVKDFDKYQKQLEKKDINQYRSFEELDSALVPFKVKEKERELESQTEKIYEDDNFLVLVPKTQEASCKYGSGTKWCVTQAAGGHFERYTKGKQGLYFIIRKKGKQTEPHYKVAVHINDIGDESWWDARDTRMNTEAVTLFKDYFPELYSKIVEDNKSKRAASMKDLDAIFIPDSVYTGTYENFLRTGKTLKIKVKGFEKIPDMPGRAMGELFITLGDDLIDAYDIYIMYGLKGNNKWSASIGFDSWGEFNDDEFKPKYDFGLWQGWGIDRNFTFYEDNVNSRLNLAQSIINAVSEKIRGDIEFEKFVKKIEGIVWRPDRIGYGYTFGKNKGLIKKLVDWLDMDKKGTKLDFLTDLGVFQKLDVDGKTKYKRPTSNHIYNPVDLRGQYSSFFASAKHAGILDYKKVGKDYFLIKGPNFDAFKEGKLRAL